MFNCSCCGTEVNSPYFYDGGVYGWTCIKKVSPSAKRNKPKTKCVEVVVIKILWNSPDNKLCGRGHAIVSIDGNRLKVSANKELNENGSEYTDVFHIGNFTYFKGKWFTFI